MTKKPRKRTPKELAMIEALEKYKKELNAYLDYLKWAKPGRPPVRPKPFNWQKKLH